MTDNLPPLPNPYYSQWSHSNEFAAFTADQMQAYARAALSQARSLPDVCRQVINEGDFYAIKMHSAQTAIESKQLKNEWVKTVESLFAASPAQPVQPAAAELLLDCQKAVDILDTEYQECKAAYESQFKELHALKARCDALLAAARRVVRADDANELCQKDIDALRAAIASAEKGSSS